MTDHTPTSDTARPTPEVLDRLEALFRRWDDVIKQRHQSAKTSDDRDWLTGYAEALTDASHDLQALLDEVAAARESTPAPTEALAAAWDAGLDAGRDRWMDSREFGDPPVNPYRDAARTAPAPEVAPTNAEALAAENAMLDESPVLGGDA